MLPKTPAFSMPNPSMAIFEDQEDISRKVLVRFSDVCEKQFSSLVSNRDRIVRYVREALSTDGNSDSRKKR